MHRRLWIGYWRISLVHLLTEVGMNGAVVHVDRLTRWFLKTITEM